MKLVTVIIPTYKRSTHLARAINSVLGQDYDNVEIIVIDDNNEEDNYRRETEDLMRQFEDNDNVHYLKHPHNMNGSAARNTGLKKSKGDYIAFLDDDDYFTPKHLSRSVSFLEASDDEVGGCCENSLKTYKNLIYKKTCYEGMYSCCYELLSGKIDYGAGSTLVIKRDVINRIGLFDTSFKRHQDWEFLIRIFRYYKIALLPDIGTVQCADGFRNYINTKTLIEMKSKIFSTFEKDITELGENKKKDIQSAQMMEVFSSYVMAKKYLTAFEFYKYYKNNETDFLHGRWSYLFYSLIIGIMPCLKIVVFGVRNLWFTKERGLLVN